jgi:hypothetical protein
MGHPLPLPHQISPTTTNGKSLNGNNSLNIALNPQMKKDRYCSKPTNEERSILLVKARRFSYARKLEFLNFIKIWKSYSYFSTERFKIERMTNRRAKKILKIGEKYMKQIQDCAFEICRNN